MVENHELHPLKHVGYMGYMGYILFLLVIWLRLNIGEAQWKKDYQCGVYTSFLDKPYPSFCQLSQFPVHKEFLCT